MQPLDGSEGPGFGKPGGGTTKESLPSYAPYNSNIWSDSGLSRGYYDYD
jgi:hypothetical protein